MLTLGINAIYFEKEYINFDPLQQSYYSGANIET